MEKIDKYDINTDLLYDPETHYWIEIEGSHARIGMSPLVQETSGSFVAIIFDGVNNELKKGQSFGSIEAEKHVGPLNAPISGIITEINEQVIENPRLINSDPYGQGWLIKISPNDLQADLPHLISGKDEILNWFKSELKKFEAKGWIAQ